MKRYKQMVAKINTAMVYWNRYSDQFKTFDNVMEDTKFGEGKSKPLLLLYTGATVSTSYLFSNPFNKVK